MIAVVNYANESYKGTQHYCTTSAYKYGADVVYEYGPNDIDEGFYNKNKHILDQKRGGGYWLWKPYVICKVLDKISYGDYIFYADSGSYFVNDIIPLIKCMEKHEDDIISFSLPFIEKQWTKKEIFCFFDCVGDKEISETCQRIATFIVLKKTERTVRIMKRYLEAAESSDLITDKLDSNIQESDFIENRHDQSIFSVLAKLENIPVYKDPSEYGIQPELLSQAYERAIFKEVSYKYGDYKQILVLHRKKNVTAYVKAMSFIRSKFPWKIYRIILNVQNMVAKLVGRK